MLRLFMLALVAVFCSAIFVGFAQAQNVSIELGADEIGANEPYTITLKLQNERLGQYGGFPNIPGFEKAGVSTSSSTNIVNGQISSSQSITQSYLPSEQGTFRLSPFTMSVNGKEVSSPGATITVGPPRQRSVQRPNFSDPLDELFGRDNQPEEFVDVKERAFLSLTSSKDDVYVGEGFTITLALYVSKQNLAELNFYQLGEQIADIRKQITPANVWEENFEIENISNQSVTINGEGYKQYKLYQATFYPNNTQSIAFPKVALKMIKYKIAKNPSFFGPRRQEDFITFTTKPINIKVKELPAHPLQASAAVGNYRLKEAVSNDRLTTGNSFTYTFTVQGEGNINYIAEPQLRNTDNFDFYDPTVARTINHRDNRVTGQKSFSYYAIPNEPGSYDIGKYFSWVFFNPHSEQYDTLIASTVLQVEGESRKNMQVDAQDAGPFYNKITSIDNTLKSRNNDGWLQLAANLIILGMLILTVVVVLKK